MHEKRYRHIHLTEFKYVDRFWYRFHFWDKWRFDQSLPSALISRREISANNLQSCTAMRLCYLNTRLTLQWYITFFTMPGKTCQRSFEILPMKSVMSVSKSLDCPAEQLEWWAAVPPRTKHAASCLQMRRATSQTRLGREVTKRSFKMRKPWWIIVENAWHETNTHTRKTDIDNHGHWPQEMTWRNIWTGLCCFAASRLATPPRATASLAMWLGSIPGRIERNMANVSCAILGKC